MKCAFDGCGDSATTRGYCPRHYQLQRRRGVLPNVNHARTGICVEDGCEFPQHARQRCNNHYRALPDRPRCTIDGCPRVLESHGLCRTHLNRSRRGDPPEGGVRAQRYKADSYRKVNNQGYIIIKVPGLHSSDGPRGEHASKRTGNGGAILEHRWVMERHLGRALKPHETAHHRNGDRSDNRLENLELWSTWQPSGQRVEDKVAYAVAVLQLYRPDLLA